MGITEKLSEPPIEAEIAALLNDEAMLPEGRDILRRLVFQRDGLLNTSSTSPGCYLPGTMPDGWGLVRHEMGKIVVTHKDGSGVLIRGDAESIAETLFYRMMDQILLGK